jgi:hypothetical protein
MDAPTITAPIFVLGMPRSGTTLVGTMISAHPNVTVAPETRFLDMGLDRHGHRDLARPDEFEAFWTDYAASGNFRAVGLDMDELRRTLEGQEARSFNSVYSVILNAYADQQQKSRTGDKAHLDYTYVDTLIEWFPDARIVVVLRDPRAVIASLLRVPWSHPFTYIHARQWRDGYYLAAELAQDDHVHIVRYEDLVTNPEPMIRTLCDFIDEPYAEEMIDRSDDPNPSKRVEGWRDDTWWTEHRKAALSPVFRDSLDRWRSELTSGQIALIEHIASDAMDKGGYTRTDKSPAKRAFAQRCRETAIHNAGRAARVLRNPRLVAKRLNQRKAKRLHPAP